MSILPGLAEWKAVQAPLLKAAGTAPTQDVSAGLRAKRNGAGWVDWQWTAWRHPNCPTKQISK